MVVNIGDKVKAKAKRKPQKKVDKLPPQAVKAPQFIYPTNDLVGQLPQPPPPPPRPPPPPPPRATATAKAQVKAPVKVPDFPSRVLNDQTPSREEILSRKELKAKVEEKEPVVVSKQSETRSLLSDAVDKMVGIKDILKQASTPLEPAPPPAPAPPQQAQDKRTQPLVPQRQSRFSNLTPQEVAKKIAEAKEQVDKRSQPLQIPQLFGTLGEPYVPSALEKSVFRDVEPASKQLIGSFLYTPTLGQPDVARAVLGSSDETKDETPFV